MGGMWVERGMSFVGVAAEHGFLLAKCREAVAALREGE
jgi:hypothetical protein